MAYRMSGPLFFSDPDNKKEERREKKQTRKLKRLRKLEAKGKTDTKRYGRLKEKVYDPFGKPVDPDAPGTPGTPGFEPPVKRSDLDAKGKKLWDLKHKN